MKRNLKSKPAGDNLRPDSRNARLHSARNKSLIARSLQEVGAGRSILVDGENIVRAGNGVFEQAQKLGLKIRIVDGKADELIAVRRKDLRGARAVQAAVLDNRTTELSDWDPDVLADLADELDQAEIPLEALGFSDEEMEDLAAGLMAADSGSGDGPASSPRTRGERTSVVVIGHLKFDLPREAFDRWLGELEAKVGNDPDRIIRECKRRLKL